jgi:hypothetical protein
VVREAVGGAVRHVADIVRRRVRCSSASCEAPDWTLYDDGGYPHRVFQLPVVASAVATTAFEPAAALATTASRHQGSARSVKRWSVWIAELAEPAELGRVCARIDPDALPPPSAPTAPAKAPCVERAGVVLRLLDRLAALLAHRGVRLRAAGCGLAAVLDHQLARFGDVAYLTRASPPLRIEASALVV